MTVTTTPTADPRLPAFDDITSASIDLAVAQWMRSPRATSLARERLRALGLGDAAIEERRRCRCSTDPHLAAVLRLAVTLIITRGRLEPRDRALLPATVRDETIAAVAQATSLAFFRVALANEASTTFPVIDLDIGDY